MWLLMFGTALSLIELIFLIGIWADDKAQRKLAEQALVIQKESLEAQKLYLSMRKKWYESRYESRLKKKEEKIQASTVVGQP